MPRTGRTGTSTCPQRCSTCRSSTSGRGATSSGSTHRGCSTCRYRRAIGSKWRRSRDLPWSAGRVPTFPSTPEAQSGRLGDRVGRLDRMHVEVEERFLFVPLLLVLLANADHFTEYFDVEAVALGFREDFPLGFVQFLDLLVDVLDALDDGP